MLSQCPTILQQKSISISHLFILFILTITTFSLTAEDLEYRTHLQQLCQKNSLTFFQHTLAKTVNNHEIQVLGITYGNDGSKKQYYDFIGSPAIILTSVMHAREDTSYRFLAGAVDHIVEEFGKGNQEIMYLLSRVVLLVMPFVNIDSVMYSFKLSQTKVLELRKNMNAENSKDCKAVSDRGVDINRNFDYNFGTVITSQDPCSQEYHGVAPFSEPESQAIRTIFQQFQITTNIDIHSYGNIWIYPYASDKNTDKIKQHKLYPQYKHIFSRFQQLNIVYDNCFNSLKYVADGVYIDWALSKNSLSFALEFGENFFVMGQEMDQHIKAMLQVFKINTNIFEYYLKSNQKHTPAGKKQNTTKLCIKSLSVLEHNVILMINEETVEGKRLAVGGDICFSTNLDRLVNMQSLRSQKVYVKLGQSNLKEEIRLRELTKIESDNMEKQIAKEQKQGFWGLLKQFKILVGTFIILCGIGCLCGLSIFFENSLGIRMNDEQGHQLNQNQNGNQLPRLGSSRMLRILKGQNIHNNQVIQMQPDSDYEIRMQGNEDRREQIQVEDDLPQIK